MFGFIADAAATAAVDRQSLVAEPSFCETADGGDEACYVEIATKNFATGILKLNRLIA
jgi:hypothetical protein